MNTQEKTISLKSMSSGRLSDDIISQITGLDESLKSNVITLILRFAIKNEFPRILSSVLYCFADVPIIGGGLAHKQLSQREKNALSVWEMLCDSDCEALFETYLAESGVNEALMKKLFFIAIEKNSALGIARTEQFVTEEEKIRAIADAGHLIEPLTLQGLDGFETWSRDHSSLWVSSWLSVDSVKSNLNKVVDESLSNQKSKIRNQFKFWLSLQDKKVVCEMWDALVKNRHASNAGVIAEAMVEAGVVNPNGLDVGSILSGVIASNELTYYKLLGGEKYLSNSPALRKSVRELVSSKNSEPFVIHLLKTSLDVVAGIFCEQIGVSYGDLNLKSLERMSLRIIGNDSRSFSEVVTTNLRIAGMAILIDKEGFDSIASQSRFEWQVDAMVKLGYSPITIMGHLQHTPSKQYAMKKLSTL